MRLFALALLSLAATCALAEEASTATEPAEPVPAPIEEVTVSGEHPGPGLWKISKDGHVMWILGTVQPLPKQMTWRSRTVEAAIAASQVLLSVPRVDTDIGFFKGLTLLPLMMGARNNPNGAKLQDVVPPDLYARWLPLKARYLGRDAAVEKWRPIFAAGELYDKAITQAGLTMRSDVFPTVKKIARRHAVELVESTLDIEIHKPGQAIKQFKKSSLDDGDCFATTLERVENLDTLRARANAWAIGDIDTLRGLPYPDRFAACGSAILSSPIVQERGLQDVLQRAEALWLEQAQAALANHAVSFAVLPLSQVLRADGYVAKLRQRGYEVEAPE